MKKIRNVRLPPRGNNVERLADGSLILTSPEPLGQYPRSFTERLEYWANHAGGRVFLGERDNSGGWRTVTYRAAFDSVQRIGQALLDRSLSADRPMLVLSGNDIEHALLGLAAMHVGVPYTSLSTGYSLVSKDFVRLHHAMKILTPGLVFAASGTTYEHAIMAAVPETVELVVKRNPPLGRRATTFAKLAEAVPTAAVSEAAAMVDGATVAKILFSSGSTSLPKGVITTHRMLCSNQQMMLQIWPFLADNTPVIVDWAPWNHVFGGNVVFGIVLFNGGSLFIDTGRPTPEDFHKSVRNLTDVAPTAYFGVPICYEMLLHHLETDKRFRERFLSRLEFLFYAGAVLPDRVWDGLQKIILDTCGEVIFSASSLGATETSPAVLGSSWFVDRPNILGLPVPGVEVKLVPNGHKQEIRVRGPSVTPGYWRQPELTARAFDAEGWYCMGDAVRFADPNDVSHGLLYDGRLVEDFKLSTAAWVNAGPLRALANGHLSPLVMDVVITGHHRNEIGLLVFPELERCRALTSFPADTNAAEILTAPAVMKEFQRRLDQIAAAGTSSSNRVMRAILMVDPPSEIEMTDKRTLSFRSVLDRRSVDIEELYSSAPSKRVLLASLHRQLRAPQQ